MVHDLGKIWQSRGFKTTDNKQIANQQWVEDLLHALHLPSKINIIKVKGHSYDKSETTKGNNLADRAAQAAADETFIEKTHLLYSTDILSPDFPSTASLLQNKAQPDDIDFWVLAGLTRDPDGLWSNKEGVIGIPEAVAPLILSYLLGPGHIGKKPLLQLYNQIVCTHKTHSLVSQLVDSCLTCAQNNIQGQKHGLHGHLPPPLPHAGLTDKFYTYAKTKRKHQISLRNSGQIFLLARSHPCHR